MPHPGRERSRSQREGPAQRSSLDEAPAAAQGPVVSVILPTYRRPAGLTRALRGLALQTATFPWEVVVVDNHGGDRAEEIVAQLSHGHPASLRYHVEARPGASHARNRGLGEASGPIVAMIDDDVVPGPGWLVALVTPILEGQADGVAGRVVLDPTVPRPRWLDERVVGRYLTRFELGPVPRELRPDEFAVTANAAFRADLMDRVGRFDPRLGPRGRVQLVSDDVGLSYALMRAGARLLWVPDAVVVHDLPASRLRRRWLLRRAYLQGRSDWIVHRGDLKMRRLNGARVAVTWLLREARQRRNEGLRHPDVRFHLLCDLARTAGRLQQAITWSLSGGQAADVDQNPR